MSYQILFNFSVQAAPEHVFKSVSDPSELEKWWPLRCTGQPKLGAEYNFFFEEPYDWYGQVAECEPGKSFRIRMTKSDPDWDSTTFGWDLKQSTKGTEVNFSHVGWTQQNRHYAHTAWSWAGLMRGLKRYLETGEVTPFDQRN